MRLFAAIPISEPIRIALSDLIQTLRRSQTRTDKIKWVDPKNYHLTLKFFGEVPEHQLPSLTSALAEAAQNPKKLTLKFTGIGAFPNLPRARVLWVGAEEDVQTAAQLAQAIDHTTTAAGLAPADKPFSAHLTLARFTAPPSKSFCDQVLACQSKEFGTLEIEQIHLMQSELTPRGPIYSIVQAFSFK